MGVEALATACASPDVLPRLTILSMFDNNIDAAGMRALASAINGGGLPCMDFRGSMLCDNPGSFEPVRAALLKRVYTIHEWLESVQSGWGDLYAPDFERHGVECYDDIRDMQHEDDMTDLEPRLVRSGMSRLELLKLRQALRAAGAAINEQPGLA